MSHSMAGPVPVIEWVNHSSFVCTAGSVRLICDPWLTGPTFNGGWRLVSPSVFSSADFDSITHIWFSHQHPDHFSPRDLKAIPAQTRARITVLFHKTIDKKVVRFCKALGFKAILELTDRKWVALSPEMSVLCETWFDRDSWIAIRAGGKTILNINDCVVDSPALARKIRRRAGPADVLLTQFSYACWHGNPEQTALREAEAKRCLDRMAAQIRTIRPRAVIPCASFVYWSHVENFFMNAEMNDVARAAEFIEHRLGTTAVVLYPGDRWSLAEDPPDRHRAAARYARDVADRMAEGPLYSGTSVPLERLRENAARYVARVKRTNPFLRLMRFGEPVVHVSDLDCTVRLSASGLELLNAGCAADVRMHSESLAYCLRAPWGANTLHANGRFTALHPQGDAAIFRYFIPADWNDHGFYLGAVSVPAWTSAILARLYRAAGRAAHGARSCQTHNEDGRRLTSSRVGPGEPTALNGAP